MAEGVPSLMVRCHLIHEMNTASAMPKSDLRYFYTLSFVFCLKSDSIRIILDRFWSLERKYIGHQARNKWSFWLFLYISGRSFPSLLANVTKLAMCIA